jgi:uncharacterized membrane protein (DUF106 family)
MNINIKYQYAMAIIFLLISIWGLNLGMLITSIILLNSIHLLHTERKRRSQLTNEFNKVNVERMAINECNELSNIEKLDRRERNIYQIGFTQAYHIIKAKYI